MTMGMAGFLELYTGFSVLRDQSGTRSWYFWESVSTKDIVLHWNPMSSERSHQFYRLEYFSLEEYSGNLQKLQGIALILKTYILGF